MPFSWGKMQGSRSLTGTEVRFSDFTFARSAVDSAPSGFWSLRRTSASRPGCVNVTVFGSHTTGALAGDTALAEAPAPVAAAEPAAVADGPATAALADADAPVEG